MATRSMTIQKLGDPVFQTMSAPTKAVAGPVTTKRYVSSQYRVCLGLNRRNRPSIRMSIPRLASRLLNVSFVGIYGMLTEDALVAPNFVVISCLCS